MRRADGLGMGGLALAALAWGLAAALPPAAPARAQGTEAAAPSGGGFVQRGVPAEATAENGVVARERGLAAGRRAAWQRLASEAGGGGAGLSDAQIEALIDSIVIEEERITPTRYSGRITVRFNPGRVRGVLGDRAAGIAAPPSPGGAIGGSPPAAGSLPAPGVGTPASIWIDAIATYRSMEEWMELRRRLRSAGPVAAVEIRGLATDRARLRIGLRAPGTVAAEDLAAIGVSLVPDTGGGEGETWRLGLAGGG